MREKIMTHLHDQMNQLRIKEHEFVAKALKQKDMVKAMSYMDKAVVVSQKHEELNKKYKAYFLAFGFQK